MMHKVIRAEDLRSSGRLEHIQSPLEVNCSMRKEITSNILFHEEKDRIVYTVNVPPSATADRITGPGSGQTSRGRLHFATGSGDGSVDEDSGLYHG